ncbi:MAG TPA: type II toxin-antitoxin system VapC family toxin [Polyangiaceae bacterium]|nr:type II toxin-antitoxin system VapC family toxin [Polyangiaceae bacterium]
MIAVDTDVIVRLVTNDDPLQSPRAARLFVEKDVFVSWTVLLEVEWVLRGAYELSPSVIQNAFERLMSAPSVTVEAEEAVAHALTWFAGGMDFADALHLASAVTSVTALHTFDKAFARRARKLGTTPAVVLV